MRSAADLVFDLDGTISSPAVGIGRSINYALEHFGYPSLSDSDIPFHKHQQLAFLLSNHMISPGATMIGDRSVDITAAKLNGLAAVGVLWGHGSLEELTSAGATVLLESPNDLVGLAGVVSDIPGRVDSRKPFPPASQP